MKFSMKRAALLAGVAVIGLASGAAATDLKKDQSNDAFIGQLDSRNFAYLSQAGLPSENPNDAAAGANQRLRLSVRPQ